MRYAEYQLPRIIAVTTPVDNASGILKKHNVLMVVEFEDGVKTLEATLTPDNTYEVKANLESEGTGI